MSIAALPPVAPSTFPVVDQPAGLDDPFFAVVRAHLDPGVTLLWLSGPSAASTEDFGAPKHEVEPGQWPTLDIDTLPFADGVVLDGCLGDLLVHGETIAAEVFARLLARHAFVIFDIAVEEDIGRAPDIFGFGGLKRALLGERGICFKLGQIASEQGRRNVLKIARDREPLTRLRIEASYQRNHASWPTDKRLLPPPERTGEGPGLAEHVVFRRAFGRDGDRYWIKTYVQEDGERIAALEAEIGQCARLALAKLHQLQPPRAAMLDLVLPIQRDGASLVFPYDPEIFATGPCHFQDWSQFLSSDVLRSVSLLAAMTVPFRGLEAVFLHNLCDFQVSLVSTGPAILDFEPNPWVIHLIDQGIASA